MESGLQNRGRFEALGAAAFDRRADARGTRVALGRGGAMSRRVLLTIALSLLVGRTVFGKVPTPVESTVRPVTPAIELSGAVTMGGEPASNLRLTFQANGSPQREWRARIKSDGTYRVKLQGDADLVCVRIERNRPLNSYSDCRRFAAGVHRVDFDFRPGVIRIEVPAFRRRVEWASVRVESLHDSAGRSFKPGKGFRGDYFAAEFGNYMVTVMDPAQQKVLASWPVTLTAEQPMVGLKLAVSRK